MLDIIIPTYNRADIVTTAIESLVDNLYPRDYLIHVGVDGTDDTIGVLLDTFGAKAMFKWLHVVQNYPRLGLGANLNHLLSYCHGLIMQMDDDHILKRPIDLTEHINELLNNEDAGWIRLMGIGAHKYIAKLREHYWYIDWNSPELYIPSNRPHIKHKRFHEHFGLYPEGLKLGQTEETWCHKCIDKVKAEPDAPHPFVLVPLNSESETAWDHIGHSFQLQGE